MKEGFNKVFEKLDAASIACPTNRNNCRKELDKELDDLKDKVDEKIAKKVDWLHLKVGSGVVLTIIAIVSAILKWGVA